jgi:phosphoribosylamine--glycine ligase
VTTVVVVGSGGREHALAHVLGRTAGTVLVTPGNPAIPGSVTTSPEELDADLFVIGPEVPLVEGLADRLRADGKRVFGPGADGARLEGSKEWMKDLLIDAGVPTARYGSFSAAEQPEAMSFLRTLDGLYVVKTDGLAAGKGVLVTTDRVEAEDDVRSKLAGESFGAAGTRVVIEEGLSGPEVSLFAVCDGRRAAVLRAPAQDHKRVGEGDTGPNTGGMGCYSPVPVVDDALVDWMIGEAIEPTLAELRRRDIEYRGVLYAGFMLTPAGPKVLEYNIRFGDPEAQVVLPRIDSDLVELLAGAADGSIRDEPIFSDDAMVTVVCASEGYPAAPRLGDVIVGMEEASELDGVTVFGAGVGSGDDGRLVTAGGRVLAVTGRGSSLASARERAYSGVALVSWPGMHHRTDIAIKEQ